jgi:PilZ domain
MFSKRKIKRIHLVYYLLIFDGKTDLLVGHVVDITTGGIKLMSKEPIKPGATHHLRMALPDGIGSSKEIRFDAKSVWSKNHLYSDFYGTGFTFEKISDEDIAVIRHLIDKFGY